MWINPPAQWRVNEDRIFNATLRMSLGGTHGWSSNERSVPTPLSWKAANHAVHDGVPPACATIGRKLSGRHSERRVRLYSVPGVGNENMFPIEVSTAKGSGKHASQVCGCIHRELPNWNPSSHAPSRLIGLHLRPREQSLHNEVRGLGLRAKYAPSAEATSRPPAPGSRNNCTKKPFNTVGTQATFSQPPPLNLRTSLPSGTAAATMRSRSGPAIYSPPLPFMEAVPPASTRRDLFNSWLSHPP